MNADDDTNQARRFHVGSTIAGRYLVERPIGEGAMGAVALARHVSLDETVAIKFLRPELRRDPVAIGRLSREAKALARIKSDHVARVLDVGATLSVGPYMVMEYLEGTDLGDLLDEEGPLPVSRAVECVLQLCEALTVAHTAGIVHRDIKPQNLFLARHGQFETLKVLDFGICDGAVASVPGADGKPYGTPTYMSPERVRNDPSADHRADIWSIGVVLHELVTGCAIFDGGELTDICARIVSDAPIVLEQDVRVLPPELRAIIARCLERDPARRYQSVEELTAALAPLATMQERFRGRTTGAFSRSMLAQELANARSLAPTAVSAPPRSASAPFAAGSVLAARLGRVVSPRAVVTALAGVVVVASLVRGVASMAPPPSSGPAAASAMAAVPAPEPARLAPVPVPSSAATPSLPEASPPPEPRLDPAVPVASPSPARAAPRRSHATRARAKNRAARARKERPLAAGASASDAPGERSEDDAAESGRTHVSRVRLVDDRRAARAVSRSSRGRASSTRAAGGSGSASPSESQGAAAEEDGRATAKPLPDWLRSAVP
jgi:eukaryotic-like serine/threonine-protein kinase